MFLARVAERWMSKLKLQAQSITNTAWAFATEDHNNERLFIALAAAAERRVKDFNSQVLANTAWAFATVGHKDEGLFTALAAAAQ